MKQVNRTVLITGGSRGIGRACALAFAQAGYRVGIGYHHSGDAALSLCCTLQSSGANVQAFQADVSDPAQVAAMMAAVRHALGPVDILIANAGIGEQKLFTQITDADWSTMLGTNLSGVFYCCREAAGSMIQHQWGRLITISSMWGVAGASCEVHYSAAKAGVIGLTKAIARELGPSGITANCIAPGVIMTDMCGSFDDQTMEGLACQSALGRIGTPEDVAQAALFLASDQAAFITGQVLGVDGGFL